VICSGSLKISAATWETRSSSVVADGAARAQAAKEVSRGNAPNAVHREALIATIDKERFTRRVIFPERSECTHVVAADGRRILDFYCPESFRPVDDEVDFTSASRAPVGELELTSSIRDPRAQVLRDQPFEGSPFDSLIGAER
jgi:hypothetical protein